MAKVCVITGKRPRRGNNVSHSNRHTPRRFEPNLQKRRIFNPKTGKYEKMRISTQGLRLLQKKLAKMI